MALYPSISETNSREKALDPFRQVLPETAVTESIDLRNEYDTIRNNRGHWIILRKFDKTRRSQYWDETTKSAVGGPAWEYIDHMIKVRKSIRRRAGSQDTPAGSSDKQNDVYYIPYEYQPSNVDQIILIDPCEGSKPTRYTIKQSKQILKVDPMRDIRGRVEFFQVEVDSESPKGDTTLR